MLTTQRATKAAPAASTSSVRTRPETSQQRGSWLHALGNQAGGNLLRANSRSSVVERAEHGVTGGGQPLPYRAEIQRAFGHHDLGDIRAHLDSGAAAAAISMGARAYTVGDRIAFAGSPDLHTAAHEAAHVLQQRAGVRLDGNAGRKDDVHERHADAVADRVVASQSSEALLDAYRGAGPGAAQAKSVQMKTLDTAYGKFEDVHYDKLTNASDQAIGCEMYLRFTPGNNVDATMIGLTQAIKPTKEGALDAVDETKRKQAATSGPGKDFYVDHLANVRNPLYVAKDPPAAAADKDKMGAWTLGPTVTALPEEDQRRRAEAGVKGLKHAGWGQHGFRKKSGADWVSQAAELHDNPTRPGSVDKKNSGQYFETTALAIEGTQKDMYYGSVQWGWERDNDAKFKLVDFKVVSKGTPSAAFMAAAEKWNVSKTSANEPTIKLPTVEVFTTTKEMDVIAGAGKIKLPVNTRVQVISKGAKAADPWQVNIVDGPHTGKHVSVDGASLKKE